MESKKDKEDQKNHYQKNKGRFMKCVDNCSFMKKENYSSVYFCSLYNKNLINIDDYYIACKTCEENEIQHLKNNINKLDQFKNIVDRM